MNELDDHRALWVQEQGLGTVQTLRHRGREVRYRLPQQIDRRVTIRFTGYGRKAGEQMGDLLLCVLIDRGQDIEAALWLPMADATSGSQKKLLVGKRPVMVTVPPGSRDGDVIHLPGAGRKTPYQWGLPIFTRKKGGLLARLCVFPDAITPDYGSLENMSDDDLNIEGWVYRKIDLVTDKLGRQAFRLPLLTASAAASLFNERGWPALAELLVARFGLEFTNVHITSAASLAAPGQCQPSVQKNQSGYIVSSRFDIRIRQDFLDDPFAVVAILSHELCHVIYSRRLAPRLDHVAQPGAELLEMERTVDLLVFLFQLGEFQMRVARQQHRTLGYFNQPLFERMYVILGQKRQAWRGTSINCGYCGRGNGATAPNCSGCGSILE